jgi:hypothetical protein
MNPANCSVRIAIIEDLPKPVKNPYLSIKIKTVAEPIFIDDALPSAALFDNAMATAAVKPCFSQIQSRSGFKTSDQVQGPRFIERGDGVLNPLLSWHDLYVIFGT